jgi:peptidyl-prolyl cis-trans isomerase A (cyclophilin A)
MEIADQIARVPRDDSDWPKDDIFIDMEVVY